MARKALDHTRLQMRYERLAQEANLAHQMRYTEKAKMLITKELIYSGISKNGGLSRKQVECLGLTWTPVKGWKQYMIGRHISEENAAEFVSLKDAHL